MSTLTATQSEAILRAIHAFRLYSQTPQGQTYSNTGPVEDSPFVLLRQAVDQLDHLLPSDTRFYASYDEKATGGRESQRHPRYVLVDDAGRADRYGESDYGDEPEVISEPLYSKQALERVVAADMEAIMSHR